MEIRNKIKPKGLFIYTDESKASVNIQKYRKVFDEKEISYIHVDFTFINKLFDEEKCYQRHSHLKCILSLIALTH